MSINHALVIDSSKSSQAIVGTLLSSLNADVVFSASIEEAWTLINERDNPFDIVIMSRDKSSADLLKFAPQLRALRHYVSVPLILMVKDEVDQSVQVLYKIGYTQVFSFKQINMLKSYLVQCQQRNTFEKNNNNKVIIIEDDLFQQEMVKSILENHYCQCFCFHSVEDALAQAEVISPDTIICDFFLQDSMTGLDFVLHAREASHPWHHVPIAILTGLDDATRKYELVRSGANDYIAKPIDELDLSVRVENLIRYKHLLNTIESQKEAMKDLALHDQLTGLYNRYFISEEVKIRIKEAKRHGIDYTMIMADIDHFKSINDHHGHYRGDQVLQEVGALLEKLVRGNDVAARLGGEEFLLLLSHCNLEQAMHKAETLRQSLQDAKPAGLEVTASFGVAQLGPDDDCFDSLFKAADAAVYRAKDKGRNRVEK